MKKIVSHLLILVILLLPFSTQAQDWPTEYQNTSRNANIVSSDDSSLEVKSTLTTSLWNFEMPVYSDGIFYISEKGQLGGYKITAQSRISGRALWIFSRGTGTLGSSPVIEGDYLIIPATTLICLNKKTGALVWETQNPYVNLFFRYPLVANNNIFLWDANAYNSGSVFKFDLFTGQQITSFKTSFNSASIQPLTLIGGDILISFSDSKNNSTIQRISIDGAVRWNFYLAGNLSGPAAISNNTGAVSTLPGNIAFIDLSTGSLLKSVRYGANATVSLIDNGKFYFLTTSQYVTGTGGDTTIVGYDPSVFLGNTLKKFDFFYASAMTNFIKIGSNFYFGNNLGEIVKYSLVDGNFERYLVDAGKDINGLMYADGIFVARNSSKTKLYFTADINYSVTASSQVTIDSPYKCSDCNQYLGQLHDHYIPDVALWNLVFNGPANPFYTVNEYKKLGYNFIALTEHNEIYPMPVTNDITQIENAEEITQDVGGSHMLAIGVRDEIGFNLPFVARVNNIIGQEGLVILAHPDSYRYNISISEMKTAIKEIKMHKVLIEAYNAAIDTRGKYIGGVNLNGWKEQPYAFDKIDILNRSVQAFFTADDDYTPGDGGIDGGAVLVNAHSNSQADIMQALKDGDFYAVQGSKAPRIHVTNSENSITLTADQPCDISFIGRGGQQLSEIGNTQSATYNISGNETYVRVEAKSVHTNKISWTQAIIINRPQNVSVAAGNHIINLDQAMLVANSTGNITAKTLQSDQLPDSFPPAGYLSPVYSFLTDGNLQDDAQLTINYAEEKLPVNENNLSIYYYNETTQLWEKVPTSLDKINKTATTQLPHFSNYVLSAETPLDTMAPTIDSITPNNLNSLNSDTAISIQASDNEAVSSVVFGLDGNYLSTDSNSTDGWNADLEINKLITGNHKLNVIAKDFAGNQTEKDFDFSVASSITTPAISISSPVASSMLYNRSSIVGNYSSSLPLDSIGIYIDGAFIDTAVVTSNSYSKEIDWSQIKTSDHTLKAVLTDIYGNKAETEIPIKVGEEVKATIISPIQNEYLRSQKIPLDVEITPSSAEGVEIFLDGNLINNDSTIDLLNFSFGKHVIEVKKEGKLLDSKEFTIITNYNDAISIVGGLFQEGHIKNCGIATAISAQFAIAGAFHGLGMERLEQKTLQHISDYVTQFSSIKKPLIDNFSKQIINEIINQLSLNSET